MEKNNVHILPFLVNMDSPLLFPPSLAAGGMYLPVEGGLGPSGASPASVAAVNMNCRNTKHS